MTDELSVKMVQNLLPEYAQNSVIKPIFFEYQSLPFLPHRQRIISL